MKNFDNNKIGSVIFRIFNIICETHINIENLYYLLNGLSEEEKSRLDDDYPIISRIRHSLSVVIILELYKLFSPNEDYSLPKLINTMIVNHSEIPWYKKIEISELNIMLQDLEVNKSQDILDKLKVVRDKYYAHLDKKKTRPNLSIDELKQILVTAEDIFSKIYSSYRHDIKNWNFEDHEISNHIFKDLLNKD